MDTTSSGKRREFDYSRREFSRVQKLIHARVGIHLGDNKQEMVYSRLARRLRATGIRSVGVYLDQLDDPDHPEWQQFINALTTNLTAFFRESHHFDTLQTHLKTHFRNQNRIRIWCCAASTGEEPYSIAMTAIEALGSARQGIEVIATDVDTRALETASAAMYDLDRVAKLPKAFLKRFFLRGVGKNQGRVRLKNEVRNLVTFQHVNLLDRNWPLEEPVDFIFCRNVFIYFENQTQAALLKRFHSLLNEKGLFFAGHSESLISGGDLFKSLGKTVFSPVRSR
ncbi:CheR family methyltransferase [Marinobacter sp. CHS3-4]|uniref:CheR family methyltransferase n=1 Tax=Marinobacter sp. CHS3-4 TaxID=3045174 RepID=UPI0024B49C38|nr:CheR family methyltransferase [Marinobacter sp. CHS3-4]MDI9245622.1 CheR family methyltransferase [Marinobacter sp. CHS3-4]